jgi:hypothetical protein
MGYKVTCNLSVGKGFDFVKGDSYTGPAELVEQLLRDGLIVEDAGVKSIPVPVEEVEVGISDDLSEELEEEKPKKSSKQKRK